MKIIGHVLLSLVGALAAVGVAVAGCGTTNNNNGGGGDLASSDLGESCTRTADCKSGLICEANVCLPGAITSGDASVAEGGDGGEAAAPATGPHLGLLRESCQTSSDCQAPLECIGNECSIVSYNLTSTGKSCSGECNTAADCCELPVNFSVSLSYWYSNMDEAGLGTYHPPVFLSNARCQDLLGYLGGDTAVCATTTFSSTQPGLAQGCFLYAAYCQCAATTWTCTNNQCSYTAPCAVPALGSQTSSQCPAQSRSRTGLSTTCNVAAGATTGTCQAGCATAADCAGKTPAQTAHACSSADAGTDTNCTCYQSACYFTCTKDIDCAGGFTCDASTHLCKAAGCTTNSDCVRSLNNPRGQCVTGACALTCSTDIECTPPSTICAAGFCKATGCTSDTDCTGTQHLFCVTSPSATYSSAVTN